MILLFHITVALLGIAQATYALFVPSTRKLQMVYGLVAGTLASGTVLVVQLHTAILSACASGLLYVAVVATMAAAARYRLAKATARL